MIAILLVAVTCFAQPAPGDLPYTLVEVLPQLLRQLETGTPKERENALRVLQRLGPQALPAIPVLEEIARKFQKQDRAFYLELGEFCHRLGLGPPALVYEVTRHEIPPEREGEQHFQYVLQLTKIGQTVDLGRMVRNKDWQVGFSEDDLSLRWLIPGQLLHIYWKTIPQGSGSNTAQCNLLLQLDGGQWREVFRDYHRRYVQMGAGHFHQTLLEFHWNLARNQLELTERNRHREVLDHRLKSPPLPPLTRSVVEIGTWRAYEFTRHWMGVLDGNKVSFQPGTAYLHLNTEAEEPAAADIEFPLPEVAAFLADEAPELFAVSTPDELLEALLALNLDLNPAEPSPATLLLNQAVPPFESSAEHLYRIGE